MIQCRCRYCNTWFLPENAGTRRNGVKECPSCHKTGGIEYIERD